MQKNRTISDNNYYWYYCYCSYDKQCIGSNCSKFLWKVCITKLQLFHKTFYMNLSLLKTHWKLSLLIEKNTTQIMFWWGSWWEIASLVLIGHPFFDDVTKKLPYGEESLLYRCFITFTSPFSVGLVKSI